MSTPSGSDAVRSRSRSRSKRSSTNLANLRLAPLSSKYTPSTGNTATGGQRTPDHAPKTPSDEAFARSHSSYLQGRSAPTTPGILSRSSSRRSFTGGLSRREEHSYDDGDDEDHNVGAGGGGGGYAYTSGGRGSGKGGDAGDSSFSRAKSDATFLTRPTTPGARMGHRRNLSGHNSASAKQVRVHARSKTGSSTPRALDHDDSWLSRASSRTSALLQESKGQSWLLARDPPPASSDDDTEDDNYEEMAALSASTAKLERIASGVVDTHSPRVSRWGSRYGSRTASARTSRYGSPVGLRTPRAGTATGNTSGYFDDHIASFSSTMSEMQERAFVDAPYPKEFSEDQAEMDRLSGNNSFGLGSMVDRVMNFRLFGGVDGGETTDDEGWTENETETEDEARERMKKEMERRKALKEKLVALPPAPVEGEDGTGKVGTWQDAAWLLSVASKALF